MNVMDNVSKTLSEVKNLSSTLLGFVAVVCSILILGIVGIAAWSKLPLLANLVIMGLLLLVFFYILIRTFNTAIKNPQPFIFNQNAFITVMREKLSDDQNTDGYFSDTLIEENTEAPKQLSNPQK